MNLYGMARRAIVLFILAAACAVLASAKTDNWLEVRTPHFIVLSNSDEKQARRVADQFERMRAVFHKAFPKSADDPASPIIVIAVKDAKNFQALEPEAYLAKGQLNLAGLFVQGQDKNYVLLRLDVEGDHPYATVYHEYTHYITRHAQEWMPLWLNEGFAEFYQTTEIRNKEVELGQPSVENIMLLRQNRLLPLATLFAVDHNSPYYHEENKGSIFYAESWALTHYLQIKERQDNTHRMMEYLKLVSEKVDSVTAATRAFGDLKVLETNLQSYISQGSFLYFKMPGATEVDESGFKVRALTVTQYDVVRADFLACSQRVKDSRALLDRVLQQEPNNVAALETMGFLAFRAGNLEEAEKWFGQAVKLDSQSFLANYYYGAISMRMGVPVDRAAQIENSLRSATKLNPRFAPAFDQLAAFYGRQNKNLDEAHLLNVTAIELEPSNVGFRMNAASILMQMDRPEDATAAMQGALKVATTSEQVTSIQSRMDSLRQYQESRERRENEYQRVVQDDPPLAVSQTIDISATQTVDLPEDNRRGPRRTIRGTLREVNCSSSATMRLKVEGPAKTLTLRTRNYYKVEYSTLNYAPKGELNPCKDIEGMKAKVEYFEAVDSAGEGQIVSVELSK